MTKSLLLSCLLLPTLLIAQLELVTDYQPGEADAFECFLCLSQQTAEVDSGLLVVALSPDAGRELHLLKNGELTLLKDINPGAENNLINHLTPRGSEVYFSAEDPVNGGAIWVTDGTESGTTLFFDPDTNNSNTRITDFKFAADSTLYVVLGTTLYRAHDGASIQLKTNVTLGAPNFPEGAMTPYQDGVAYFSNGNENFGGGLFLATDTIRLLGDISSQGRFDQGFGLRELNGNLLFSLSANAASKQGTYQYDAVADTLIRYEEAGGAPQFFITRWYPMSDSLHLGLSDNKDFYLFDGITAPSLFYAAMNFTLAAREVPPFLSIGDFFFWQTNGGVFEDEELVVATAGDQSSITTVLEGRLGRFTNLITAGGYVFFAAEAGSDGPIPFYRYELATGELVNFYDAPARADRFPYSIQLLTEQDGLLYLAVDADPAIGHELYSLDPGVDIVSVFGQQQPPVLGVQVTSENFTIQDEKQGIAQVSVFDLGGRLLQRDRFAVNSAHLLPSFSGIRIYVFEYEGKVAVRRVLGR